MKKKWLKSHPKLKIGFNIAAYFVVVILILLVVVIGVFLWRKFLWNTAFPFLASHINTVASLGCIVIGAATTLVSLRSTEVSKLKRVIRSYLSAALFFSGVYCFSYISNPTNFSFSSGIMLKGQVARLTNSYHELNRGYRNLGLLSSLRIFILSTETEDKFSHIADNIKKDWFEIEAGVNARIFLQSVPKALNAWLEFKDSGDNVVTLGGNTLETAGEAVSRLISASSRTQFIKALDSLISMENKRVITANEELRGDSTSRTYNILDFVYFSFVTVTTLGYGDIVPNTTLIRLLVVAQILFGVFLIVSKDRNTREKMTWHVERR